MLDFRWIGKATFVDRPNRFLVRCRFSRRRAVEAFLPNPGRMHELLFPGSTLYVTSAPRLDRVRGSSSRKTRYTVLAVERDGAPVFLHTHLANRVARRLIEERRIPALADMQIARAEVPAGNSRFDFLLKKGAWRTLLEVKSCTLFGNGVAMFPDAVTARGRRHLVELAALGRRDARPCILFLVHTPRVDWFMPDYHTDLDFSRTLLELRHRLSIVCVAVEWTSDLTLGPDLKELPVPWSFLEREVEDRGSYVVILKLPTSVSLVVGSLGVRTYRAGYHLYVGSAMRNLSARVARHARKRKRRHWHIDYLRDHASEVTILPIRSSRREECRLARTLAGILDPGPPGFGASDCDCSSHLFWQPADPLDDRAFHRTLQRFRMKRPPESPRP